LKAAVCLAHLVTQMRVREQLLEAPAYTTGEVSRYLRVPLQTIRYWALGRGSIPALINVAAPNPPRLSYLNLLECHMLSAMRAVYDLRIPKVRRTLKYLAKHRPSPHPLLTEALETNRIDIFVRHYDQLIAASKDGQLAIKDMLKLHLERIERDAAGLFKFFPFVEKRVANEPRLILIDPQIGFGKPVIAGTSISTAVVVSRFHARESISSLAEEYQLSKEQVEEAIRWEQAAPIAA
jgi:uncharacterized protein (DUF433 family)